MPHPDAAVRLRALSVSHSVAEFLHTPHTGRVIATFARSSYLEVNGRIVALVAPELLNGPLNIRVSVRPGFAFDSLPVAGPVTTSHDSLLVTDVHIDLRTATVWNATARPLSGPLPAIRMNLGALNAVLRADAPAGSLARTEQAPERAAAAMALLADALKQQDAAAAGDAARRLAGLGAGLTPSGDDVLAGALVALAVHPPSQVAELRHAIISAARGKTTTLSTAYLIAAAQGEAGEAWHGLIATLGREDAPAVTNAARVVMAFGETSGADMLAGFALALGTLTGL